MSKINIEHIKDDIENLEIGGEFRGVTPEYLLKILRQLKRSYEQIDELIEALKIIRDDLDDALETQGYNTLAHEKSEKTLQKIRNFANDASQ